jgi:hypothetical protein
MRRRMTWAFGVVLTVLTGPAFGQPPAAPDPDALFAAARPHLEAVLGRRLERLPIFRTVTPAELAALPDGLLNVQAAWQYHDLEPAARDRARTAATAALRGATVAGLRERSEANLAGLWVETVLVAPENAARIARWDESLARVNSEAFLRLALVHETVRCLLDWEYGLSERRAACRDSEELIGLQAMVEGRCQWVTRQVARRLGEEATFPLLAEAYRRAPDAEGDGTARVLGRDGLDRRHWCCVKGLAFFEYLEKEGVKDAEARAFARPPRQVAWVERPELYLRSERLNLGDLADVLKRLEGSLPAADWQAAQQPWTAAMLREAAAWLGEGQRAEKVAQGWNDGRLLVWSARANPGRQVAVGLVRFQDEAAARAYYGLAADLQRKQDELLAAAGRRPVESHVKALRLNGADEAMRADKTVHLQGQGEGLSITQVWARVGERVVEFTWRGVPGDADWAQRVLDAVLKEK